MQDSAHTQVGHSHTGCSLSVAPPEAVFCALRPLSLTHIKGKATSCQHGSYPINICLFHAHFLSFFKWEKIFCGGRVGSPCILLLLKVRKSNKEGGYLAKGARKKKELEVCMTETLVTCYEVCSLTLEKTFSVALLMREHILTFAVQSVKLSLHPRA